MRTTQLKLREGILTETPTFKSLQGSADVVDDTGSVDPLATSKPSAPQSFTSLFDGGSVLGLAEPDALTSSASELEHDDAASVMPAGIATDQAAVDVADSGTDTVALSEPAIDQDAIGGDNDKFLLSPSSVPSATSLSSNNTINNNTEATSPSFDTSALRGNDTGAATFTGSVNQNVGVNSADASALSNERFVSSLPPIDPTGQSATAPDKAVPPVTTSQLTPALTIDAATNPADVTFTVSGLQAGDHGTATFMDAKGVQDVVNVGSNGNYTTNLSNLAIGTIDYTLSVTDPAGHVTTVDPSTSLGTVAGFALDANGWPIITPQSNSQIIYVSSSTGNDNNNGLTPQTAVATIAKGESLLRNGYPDELLLKAGDTFVNQSFGDLNVSGQSASAPMVIGTYGTGPAPIVETNPNQDGGVAIASLPGRGGNFLVVEGIDFYSYTRDPSNPAYAGPNTSEVGADFINPNTWVMLAGDKFNYYSTNIVFQAASSSVTPSTLTLYRNVITNAWSANSHSQGVFVAGVANLVIEQNIFDHNGWNASIPGAEQSIFNRNVYLQFNNGPVTFTGNISANSSSEGAQFRSGGTITGNLFLADSAGFSFGENPGTTVAANGQVVPIPTITSTLATGNVILNSTSINSSSGVQPRSDGIQVFNASGPGVQVTNNIVADAVGPTVNESGISLNTNVTGVSATNNIIYDVANPVVDSGTGNTTSPNAINQTGYVNPNVSIGSYNASLGGSASLAAFMAAADNQSMTNWNPAYTAAAADSYIQAGFATMVTKVTASPTSGVEVTGDTITLTMDFGQAITVTGTPTLSLNDGGTATYTGGSGTNALTFNYTVGESDSPVSALAITAVNLPNGATVNDAGGNPSNFSNALVTFSGLQIDPPTGPTLTSIVESPASGDLNAGKTVTLTMNLNEAVTVAGGTPTLTLNDGGTATYSGGSGTNALTFSYTVGAGQNTAALVATAVNLNAATVKDGAGNAASLSLSGLTQSGPQIDTVTPAITSLVESPASGDLNAGKTVTLTMNLNEAVTVAGGTPTLILNDGGTATYTGGSSTNALTFSYTVGAGQNAAALAATAVNLNSATVKDGAGNAANLSLTGLTQSGPQIDTTTPTISSLTESPSSGDLNAGKTVTLTMNLNEAVTVAGGTPTLTLNDGGTATYTGGSSTNALTFSYAVGAGQNAAALAATAVNLNSATVTDGAGNAASLSLSGLTQSGPQIDTVTPAITSLVESPASGDLNAGKTVTLTMNLNEAVMVAGGTPTLTLNDGGTATYTGGSSTNALTFSYTVGAGQNAVALAATAVNLNAATVTDGAGNTANLSLTGLTQIGPQIDGVTPAITSLVESPASGDLNAGKTVTLTVNLNEAVTVAGGTPTLTLNDGGTATYSGGSGTNALTFSYTGAAGQNTAALAATAVDLNAATVKDGAGNAANLSLTGLTQSGPQIDTLTPAITSLVESPASGDLNAGKAVTLTMNLNEAATVAGGTPTLTLNDGGIATYTGGSGTNALTFSYTVGAGQNTAALVATAVNLNSATVTDGAGNAANLSLTGLTQSGPQIDTTIPSVAAVSASPSNGVEVAGNSVKLTLDMSEAVTVTGTPTLTLNDGGTATYTGGSSSHALSFTYTVGAGDSTVAALAIAQANLPSGATITDGAGNAANLSLTGLTQSGPQIDTTSPSVTAVSASPSSGLEVPGDNITLTLTMSEAVTVTGTPTLTLNDGGTATYTGGSGSNALTFAYMVGAGDSTVSVLAITQANLPNGATITDGAGNAANLSLTGLTQSGPQIDTLTPTVSSLVESPASGDLNAGQVLTLTLNLNEAVTVAGGTPTLTLNDGGTATSTGGSDSNALTFSYTVAAGQNTASLAATAINLNSATVKDGAGNAANLSLAGLTQSGPQIDTTAPTISSMVESPATGDLNAGKVVMMTLNMSEVVTVDTTGGIPTLRLNDGGTATYTGGSGTNALTFSYTVAADQNTPDLMETAINLNGATIEDGAGNAANLSLIGLPQGSPQIDTTTPTISSLVESPATGDLNAGKVITMTLNLSEVVTVDTTAGTPTLTLNDGGTATYTGGSGSNALIFSYTVGSGQNTSGLAATAINLNSATVTDGAGNAANLSLSGLTQSGPQIDTLTPTISSLVESPASGDFNAGKAITFTLNLNKSVTVSGGTPTLILDDGGTATYSGGSGSNALTFSYTVAAGQNTAALAATAVNLNSATITDGAGNAANLSLSGLTQNGPQIDTMTPAITSLVESPSSGDINAGKTVTFTLNLNEAATVSGGTPTLTLNDGGTATYTSGSGSNALTFGYTVAAGQNTSSLAATAINLNSASITDRAGNAANLSLSGLTQSGPQIDTLTPTISSLAESPASGDLNAGKTVTFTLNLNEAATVSGGTPTLTLNDGGTAIYTGGSGSNALTFSCTVAAGQNTASLAATAINLNSASITDGAGNVANLSLSGLTQSGPQIDTLTPTISSLAESPASGDFNAGKAVTFTLNLNEAVTVAGGSPTLTLNDGGTAIYTGGSGSNALTFGYTVAAGQNAAALAATAINLNSASITDGAGNAANLSLSGLTQSGTQIDTLTPTISSLAESPASGDLNAGKIVTFTLNSTRR